MSEALLLSFALIDTIGLLILTVYFVSLLFLVFKDNLVQSTGLEDLHFQKYVIVG